MELWCVIVAVPDNLIGYEEFAPTLQPLTECALRYTTMDCGKHYMDRYSRPEAVKFTIRISHLYRLRFHVLYLTNLRINLVVTRSGLG